MLQQHGCGMLPHTCSSPHAGCMFFLSDDEKFLIKTMRKTEIHTLLEILPRYYEHMANNPNCLIIRFYGVHGVKQVHGRTVRCSSGEAFRCDCVNHVGEQDWLGVLLMAHGMLTDNKTLVDGRVYVGHGRVYVGHQEWQGSVHM